MPSERIQRQIERLLDEADDAASRLDWDTVRTRAKAALGFDAENADASEYLQVAERNLAAPDAPPAGASAPLLSPGTPPIPEAFVDGRYEVKRFLGEGGKKRVYLAHDVKLDRDVAFAIIKTDGLDDEGLLRIKREAQAMGRLGDHPHIVSVYDIGEEGGQPYLVSQLMGGGDVEGLIEKAENHRVPLEIAVKIADQVCQALEHAHSHGIVHRDLKPGNVWLTTDGTAKLGDFGLAVTLDRSRLTQAGMMVGTVSYMPPEQAMGGEVTPRSDLYSLGAMLYELVTGRPPFVGDESVAVITQHLNTPPVAPSWHVPSLAPGLEALILRLLEKDASRRPASAAEVQDLLAAGARPHPSVSPVSQSPTPSPQNPMYRRTFVGREAEVRQLQHAFDAALSGQGSLVAVVGEPGIGKTALCEQITTYAAVRGGKTLVGHCYEEGSLSLPYLAFIEALRSYVLDRDPEGLKQDLGSGAAEVARIISEVRDRVALSPGPSPNPSAGSGQAVGGGVGVGADPDEDRWRLYQALSGFLRNASAVQPLLVILEDLHWADRGTLDLLVYLARQLSGTRLLIVGNYRDVEVDRAHPLSGALAELRRGAAFLRLPLRGLTADEVHRMMIAIVGQDVSWSLAEAVHRQTEGNPLFVQEVLRYLAEEGLVQRQDGRWQRTGSTPLELQIPEGLRDVIGKRLNRLSAECNRVLSVAAVIGRDFQLRTLQTVSGLDEDAVSAVLEDAERVGVIEDQSRAGLLRFRFAHAFFRQTLYEELFSARRLRLHQDVARALEHQYANRLEEHAAELAEHFAQSTDPEDLRKAVRYGELGAQRAMSVYAYGEAARLLDQALQAQEVLDPDDRLEQCDLLLALGEALNPAGEPDRVINDVAERAFVLAESLGDEDRAGTACEAALEAGRRAAGSLYVSVPRFSEWAERLDRVAAPGTARRVRADVWLTQIMRRSGRASEARSLATRCLELARQLGEPTSLLWAAAMTMMSTGSPGQWRERIGVAYESASWPRAGARRHAVAEFLVSRHVTLLAAGDRDAADAAGLEIAELGEGSHDPELLIQSMYTDGLRLFLDGDLEGVVAAAARLSARAEELGSAVAGATLVAHLAARPLVYLGRFEEAVPLGSRAPGGDDRAAPLRLSTGEQGLYLAHAGRTAEAAAGLSRDVARIGLTADEDDTPIRILATLLETAVLLEDRGAAALIAPKLAGIDGRAAPLACVALPVGRAYALLGDREAARTQYERALDWTSRLRFRPEIALTRLALAELLLDEAVSSQLSGVSNEGGERKLMADKLKAEGSAHLDFAIEEFRAMKMQPSLERALRHKGLLNA